MSKSELLKSAEKEVDACLNYGGVFHEGSHTTKELELVYEMGDVEGEVAHMRRFSKALSELADAVEADMTDKLSHGMTYASTKDGMSNDRPTIDMAEYLNKRQEDGKPLIIIDPTGDRDLLSKIDDIKSAMDKVK